MASNKAAQTKMVRVDGNTVEFSFFRPQARQVHVAGDFNNWRADELPMSRTPKGYWRALMQLPAGEFRFRYRADGQWFTDFAAFGVEYSPFGLDSVVYIPPVREEPKSLSPQSNVNGVAVA